MVWTVWEGLSWDVWGRGGPSPVVGGWMVPVRRTNPPPLGGGTEGRAKFSGGPKYYYFGSSPLRTSPHGFKNPPTSPPKVLAAARAFSDKLKTLATDIGIW